MKLVAEKLGNDLSSLSDYESQFREGDKGELRLYVDRPLYQDELEQLGSEILGQGVNLTDTIKQDARIVMIRFEKRIAPLLIIALAVGALGVGILGWQMWQTTMRGVPLWVWGVGIGALLYLIRK